MFAGKTDKDLTFMKGLYEAGFNLFASKGTAEKAVEAYPRLPITDIAELTGQGPILDHMVVSLDQHIHAMMLAGVPQLDELQGLKVTPFHVVAVTLYDLETAVLEFLAGKCTREYTNSKADRGGVAALLSACKGDRIVISDHSQYDWVIGKLRSGMLNAADVADLQAAAIARCVAYLGAESRFRQLVASGLHQAEPTPYQLLGSPTLTARVL